MHTTTLADPARLQQFALLCGTPRPFVQNAIITDHGGIDWACVRIADQLFAVPAKRLNPKLSFGSIAERILWLVHCEVRTRRTREISLSWQQIRSRIWRDKAPRNWLRSLRAALRSMSQLRVGEANTIDALPSLEDSASLFEEIAEDAKARDFIFVLGSGFLGSLEQFAGQDGDDNQYSVPANSKLRDLRKAQKIAEIYLPIYLGDPSKCREFSARQKRLLQAVIRELTLPPRKKENLKSKDKSSRRSLEDGELILGDFIRDYNGRGTIRCSSLDPDTNYVGFNGNGVRRGQGYLLATWRNRAGYLDCETQRFLADLQHLSQRLGLIIGAASRSNDWYSLDRLRVMLGDRTRRQQFGQLHGRVYSRADCVERWNRYFGWDEVADTGATNAGDLSALDDLRTVMEREGLLQQQVAARLGVSRQAVSRMLRQNRCSAQMRDRIRTILDPKVMETPAIKLKLVPSPDFRPLRTEVPKGSEVMLSHALRYHAAGWSVIPIRSWLKDRKPYVQWREFQEHRPSIKQINDWWTQWPDAGIAVVLGPVSDLLCVDVDGEGPHRILIGLLGEVPMAPTVKSGSNDPFRYHLYFRCPAEIDTGAKATPWNLPDDEQKLELRGHRGLLVLPPSRHKSGRRYCWVRGRTLRNTDPPNLPQSLLDGLARSPAAQPQSNPAGCSQSSDSIDCLGVRVAASTAAFLEGQFAELNGAWNDLLFKAACDLHARGIPQGRAEQLLLNGARPRSEVDQQIAVTTIASAFSQPRSPSSC